MRSASIIRVTDEQWKKLEPLLPTKPPGVGRPWADNRGVFEGILWILKTGARWRDLPEVYPSPATCWRRLNKWEEEDVWEDVWQTFLGQLDDRGVLDWNECFMDATFMAAKKGVSPSEKLAKGRAQSAWFWQTVKVYHSASSLPLRRLANRLSPSKRSQLYEYLAQEDAAGLARFLRESWPTAPTTPNRSGKRSARKASTSSRRTQAAAK